MATNYEINYDDKRFSEVEADKKAALNEVDVTYGNMISQSDQYYQKQIDAAQDWADKQTQLQQEQTDFAIEQIEQQKAQAKQDYTREQSGAYVDWQKQSDQYGTNAEQMAAQGMANTGYSESSQVSMYNTYQNRVAAARESYNRAVLNYDNAIKDARLQNNAALAEIAYQALQAQLELSLEGFQYKNSLILAQADKKLAVENTYYNRYLDVLNQMNTENALAEEVRQYNASLASSGGGGGPDIYKDEPAGGENVVAAVDAAAGAAAQNVAAAANKVKDTKTAGLQGNAFKEAKKGKGSNLTVDMNSVLSLGYGPISAARLNSLISQGLVEEYESGGKLKYRKSAPANKQNALYQSIR